MDPVGKETKRNYDQHKVPRALSPLNHFRGFIYKNDSNRNKQSFIKKNLTLTGKCSVDFSDFPVSYVRAIAILDTHASTPAVNFMLYDRNYQ